MYQKIICKVCGHYWILERSAIDKCEACPFCMEPIRKKTVEQREDIVTFEQAFCRILNDCGTDILSDKRKTIAYLTDIAPQITKETRVFSKISSATLDVLKGVLTEQGENIENEVLRLSRIFKEEEGLSDLYADLFCAAVRAYVVKQNDVKNGYVLNVEVGDFEFCSAEKTEYGEIVQKPDKITYDKIKDFDVIEFGTNHLEWIVIKKTSDNTVLLMCNSIVAVRPIKPYEHMINWLNTDFLSSSFGSDDKRIMLPVDGKLLVALPSDQNYKELPEVMRRARRAKDNRTRDYYAWILRNNRIITANGDMLGGAYYVQNCGIRPMIRLRLET